MKFQGQPVEAQNIFRALINVARARQVELEDKLVHAQSPAEAWAIREQLAKTRNAVLGAERLAS